MFFVLTTAALLILATAWSYGSWLPSLESSSLSERMVFAIALVAVPGFFMGWLLPLGMTYFTIRDPRLGSWYWAINGATSVLASILAAAISVICGIQTTLIVGSSAYLLALLALF